MNFGDLAELSRTELRACLETGCRVEADDLGGSIYEGISLGLPSWVTRLTWTRFQKAFYADPSTGRLRGWNIKTVDGGLEGEWVDQTRAGRPKTFGYFDVCTDPEYGLILDYSRSGRGGNGVLNAVRDPLVSLSSGSAELLLGWTYLALAGRSIGTPSFFALRRGRAIDYVPGEPS